jgi:hypothetical protein
MWKRKTGEWMIATIMEKDGLPLYVGTLNNPDFKTSTPLEYAKRSGLS